METLNFKQHYNSLESVSRKRPAVFTFGETISERKRLCVLEQDYECFLNHHSDKIITNCERKHLSCDQGHAAEISCMETNLDDQISTFNAFTNNQELLTESIDTDIYPSLYSCQPMIVEPCIMEQFNREQKGQSQANSCSRCKAGQPGHIHHIKSF